MLSAAVILSMSLLAGTGTPKGDEALRRSEPVTGMHTRWSADVDSVNPHPEHPRPQFRREQWMSLNGQWEYAIRPLDGGLDFPTPADGTILVPFPLESALSGVGKSIDASQRLLYRRAFTAPPIAPGKRVLLHFEAVDWGAKVFLNGALLGDHAGGFDPFHFDVTDHLRSSGNELIVTVWDPTDEVSDQEPPRGKQVRAPQGIWYTSVTGIWQSVWLEWVPERSIASIRVVPDLARQTLSITPRVRGEISKDAHVEFVLRSPDSSDGVPAAKATLVPNVASEISIADPKAWSPESPSLYTMELRYGLDRVESYVAFRTVSIGPDSAHRPAIHLNGAPYFMLGTLDQGWWPDGLYTAPTHEAMLYDLEVTKALGFNTVRKHVKVEPATWYAACDRLGLLVWQDMPSSGPYIGPQDPDAPRGKISSETFERELASMIERLSFHPSIVMWVPFNEGWGQYDTARITDLVKKLDPTRLANSTSGWADRGVGDLFDVHDYGASLAGRCPTDPTAQRAVVIGEFGGLGLPTPGHLWQESGWGYRSFKEPVALTDAYVALLDEVAESRYDGLSGAIYTQTTDVELEVNGLMTYDRDVLKMTTSRVRAANAAATRPISGSRRVTSSIACAADGPAPSWRYVVEAPPANWAAVDFDDRGWTEGRAGFGTEETPGAIVGTQWTGNEIWLRRSITIDAGAPPTHLLVHHDENADIYLDSEKIAALSGYTSGYVRIRLSDAALARCTAGKHTLAVHCRQTRGGQFIDVGAVRVENVGATEAPR